MSVSAHLTPEPERRLWLILESMRHAVDSADLRIGALDARPGRLPGLGLGKQ